MAEITEGINWLAVGAGTVVSFLLGWLWYSPKLFGKQWAAGIGVDLGSSSEMPAAAMITQLLATFLMAWIIGVTAKGNMLLTAILVVLTLVAFNVSNGFFAKKKGVAVAIESGFIVAMAVVMIAAQGLL